MVLPLKYHVQVLQLLHDGQCHQGTERIIALCWELYGVEQSTNMPYNPHGNAPTERLNHTLIGLLQSLPKEQKSNWPLHLPLLVFAYNATLHDATGYQPYELMTGFKAPNYLQCMAQTGEL